MFDESQAASHSYFMALRNKYAAHSENAFEDNRPVARYWVERVPKEGIQDIHYQQLRTIGLGPGALQALRDLITVLKPYVRERIDAERARVLAIVRELLLSTVLAQAPIDNSNPSAFQTRRPY